jgi:hypothetical protein
VNKAFVKQRLAEYLRLKGITPDERGNIRCLWHEDRHPSCHLYETSLYCFSCNEHGDIFKAAAALLDVPHDKRHFPQIAADVAKTLRVEDGWTHKPEKPRSLVRMSQSHIYREGLLADFADAVDTGNMEKALYYGTLLFGLFQTPDAPPPPRKTLLQRLTE